MVHGPFRDGDGVAGAGQGCVGVAQAAPGVEMTVLDLGFDAVPDAFTVCGQAAPVTAPLPNTLNVGVLAVEDFSQAVEAPAHGGVEV
ncbi:hypothetical protein OHA84_01750 [Streptomyces sp. NBC_00513]|uniref:hypothetical protein n=1 Tax=unclassified Streptomyces TaxID=2593676 RepID=UPI00224DA81F|nr:hypothetical protein [Streptomyces sp. NBC_00424]MCX5079112.1 hypothetical protein [Streptomyces sp. NBC_00424]WUD39323.1 hypothetical protein OHA84_01750 [Streptomyces sp. NBC_00513]